jgi:hypothetical protein
MNSMRRVASILLAGTFVLCTSISTEAQQVAQPSQAAVSANPFGILIGFLNAEYERTVSESATVGLGGSSWNAEYVNADLFYRYYPAGTPLEGWSFGVKVGVTKPPKNEALFGFGFDTNWSWLLGKKHNFYVSTGVGLKRLYGTSVQDFGLQYIPMFRLVNIGYAF